MAVEGKGSDLEREGSVVAGQESRSWRWESADEEGKMTAFKVISLNWRNPILLQTAGLH